jgi:hypothetical protein
MSEDINIEITEQVIDLVIEGGATWGNIEGKPEATAENDFMMANSDLEWENKSLAEVQALITAQAGADEKVKYDAADPTAGYLSAKVIAGTSISVTEGSGADENKLKINFTGTIPGQLSDLTDDATHRLVTDTEKSTWNGKADVLGFTPENVTNKKTTLTDSDTDYPTTRAVNSGLAGKQATLQSGTTIKTINSTSLLGSGDIVITAGAQIWTDLTGAYASTTTFTFTGTTKDVNLIQLSLFTCTSSDGNTRRIGYIKSSVNNAGTITATVVTDSNLTAGDINFKVAYNRKVTDYQFNITIPGEQIADTAYSQGMFKTDLMADAYLLPVDASVLTAAAGAGAALTYNVYKNTTALFNTAPDLTTNTVLRAQRPTTNTLSAAETISLRIMSSAGATNKASNFQAKLFIVPQLIYTAF